MISVTLEMMVELRRHERAWPGAGGQPWDAGGEHVQVRAWCGNPGRWCWLGMVQVLRFL